MSAIGLICIAVIACGGRSVVPSASAPVPVGAIAYGTVAIDFHLPGPTVREPAYISAGTTRAAVFIDGLTAPAGSTTTCVGGCVLTWTAMVAVPAAHTFAVEIDNGTYVLAENQGSYALHAGNNGAIGVLTLEGVSARGAVSAETCATTSCSGTLTIADASASAIVNTTSPLAPGFDNGTVTLASTASGVGTVTAGATVTQPTATGTSAYTVTCAASASYFLTTLTPASTTGSGDITPAELIAQSLTYPAAIAYPSDVYSCAAGTTISRARIFVGQNISPGVVGVYLAGSNGAAATLATIGGGSTGVNRPQGIAFDATGRVYVANDSANTVTMYAANPTGSVTTAPVLTLGGTNTGMNGTAGMALEPTSGRVFVVNYGANSVTAYAANQTGTQNVAPVLTISGTNTLLNGPASVAFDASGRVYVTNLGGGGSVLVFAANQTGTKNVAPVATISGGSTGVSNPVGVALDASGRVYVSNDAASTVTVYAANPVGSITTAPVATIGGGGTGVNNPVGVALDVSGRVYVANGGANTVTMYAANPIGSVTSAPLTTITGVTTVWGIAVH